MEIKAENPSLPVVLVETTNIQMQDLVTAGVRAGMRMSLPMSPSFLSLSFSTDL